VDTAANNNAVKNKELARDPTRATSILVPASPPGGQNAPQNVTLSRAHL